MKIETAISMLSTEEPWRLLSRDDFAAYVDGQPAWEYPWFVLNQQETIQFRMMGQVTDAVFLRSEEVAGFASLCEQLESLGFALEQRIEMSHQEFVYNSFRRDNIRVKVPRKLSTRPGFHTPVTVERIP